MPWWTNLYLCIYTSLVVCGLYDDYVEKKNPIYCLFGIISGGFVFTFVFAYFYPNISNTIGIWVVPMTIFGVIWELIAASDDIHRNQKDPELTENENKWIENIALVLVNLVIVPGYFFGIILSYNIMSKDIF